MSDGRCPCCGANEWCAAENAKADARELKGAITRACGLLARAWESENDPRNTELGVVPDVAREMAVAAQREEDQLRTSLATITAERDAFDLERREKGDALLFHIKAYDLERAAHDETRKGLDTLARVVGQALIVPTLEPGESLSEPLDHALIAIVLGQHAALESTRKALEVAEQALIAECENACSLGAALARSEARVKAALEYANGRWSEWGDRAERVRDILEGNDNG